MASVGKSSCGNIGNVGRKSGGEPLYRDGAEREKCTATACMIYPLSISPSYFFCSGRIRSSFPFYSANTAFNALYTVHSCIHAFAQRKAPFLSVQTFPFHIYQLFRFSFLYFFSTSYSLPSPCLLLRAYTHLHKPLFDILLPVSICLPPVSRSHTISFLTMIACQT